MKERIATAVGAKTASRIWMGAFHSIFLRILRSRTDLLGFRHDFTIYDSADSKALIKTIIKDMVARRKGIQALDRGFNHIKRQKRARVS